MNADGSNQTRLTDGPKDRLNPSWSPDGTRIAFRGGNHFSGIYVMNADGSDQTKVTDNRFTEFVPSWSPVSTATPLPTATPVPSPTPTPVPTATAAPTPEGSPGLYGTKIVFVSDRDGNPEIYVMNPDGS